MSPEHFQRSWMVSTLALGVLAATAAGTFRCPAEFWAGVTKERGLASCGFISAEGLGRI